MTNKKNHTRLLLIIISILISTLLSSCKDNNNPTANNDVPKPEYNSIIKIKFQEPGTKKISIEMKSDELYNYNKSSYSKNWIDLNNNNKEDEGELFEPYKTKDNFTITDNEVTIRGYNAVSISILYLDRERNIKINSIEITSPTVSRVVFFTDMLCKKTTNPINLLKLTNCPNLKVIQCDRSRLKKIELIDCLDLEELSCEQNSLENLDISNCPNLEELDCQHNCLKSL